jgi:hypothetical protein
MTRKMDFSEVRWFGAWGAIIATLDFLVMATDHDGWEVWLDLFFAAYAALIAARFLRLKTIEVKGDALVVKINDVVAIDTSEPRP